MLYHLLYPLREFFFGFNVFRYITFRAALASILAFVISLVIGPLIIRFLHGLDAKQSIERAGFDALYGAHRGKEKVPTMGGILIVLALVLSTFLCADLSNEFIWLSMLTVLCLGLVGYWDDALKLSMKNSKGLSPIVKLGAQGSLGLIIGIFLYLKSPSWQEVSVPFLKDWFIVMGPLYILFVAAVITGASNAVNLTDGLDGLAIGCTAMIALTYGIFSYVAGNAKFSDYLAVPFVPGAGELAVFCAALFGACMGFLWFNSHPASVFMGDVGSLSIGGALGIVSVFTKKELLLIVVGGVFVLEALSVILQVASYKLIKKRIFLMAPIHHHFQLRGITESKVVIRFWIGSLMLALCGLSTLKLQ
jgi:phospho-N-acetylmuramoyl-pentapeptide-transferase